MKRLGGRARLGDAGIDGCALIMGRDREAGVLRRLRVTPAPGWAIIAGRMTTQAITGLALALVIVITGARIDSLPLSLAQYGLVLGITVFLSIGIGQALVGLIRSADTVNAAGRAVFAVLALLGLTGQPGVLGGVWVAGLQVKLSRGPGAARWNGWRDGRSCSRSAASASRIYG